ncbi:MAG TPA: hypothetical protein G4N96_09530 [Chloroflexi bacterium]|nr:hypothetical protein [Chloroflexota bacterium]
MDKKQIRPFAHSPIRLFAYSLILLAMALRFYRLGAQSLWSDEGNSLALAQASFAEIAARTAFDIHPPFYYWLLKIWLTLFGTSEFAARSLSAMLGVLLVAIIYRLGARLFSPKVGVTAAFIAAISPFQVYYAQEARMYMLLTVLGAAAASYGLRITSYEFKTRNSKLETRSSKLAYIIIVTLGLYTHYAFPVMLVVINLAAIVALWSNKRRLLVWLGLQLIPLALYLPWLPIAWRQITTWPSLMIDASPAQIALTLLRQLSLGPSGAAVSDWWLMVFGVLVICHLSFVICHSPIRHSPIRPFAHSLILLWLLIPAALTALLFRPAYLKFLLIASPAFSLVLGWGLTFQKQSTDGHGWTQIKSNKLKNLCLSAPVCAQKISFFIFHFSFFIALTVPSLLSLNALYHNPAFQRDNYKGIAAFIQALATEDDAIIIHAPGQQEVFGYYYQSGPGQARVYPLPRQRPLDTAATISELEGILANSKRIYAIYWATEEADPEGLIETWLAQHTFKASDVWFGNVRLLSYAAPAAETTFTPVDFWLGAHIHLTGYALSPEKLSPGEILQVSLRWETDAPLKEDYTVFLQLLDEANHLVGQRDAPSLSSAREWSPGQAVEDQHGLLLLPGTPPTPQRLIVGLYNSATGKRLTAPGGQDYLELAEVEALKNTSPLPVEAFQMQHQLSGPLLLGYDLYKLGYASDPDAPLHPGDPLHLNLYWQKPSSQPEGDAVELRLLNSAGDVVAMWKRPIADVNYPPQNWADGEIVRGQFDLFLSDVSPGKYRLVVILDGKQVGVIQKIEVEG